MTITTATSTLSSIGKATGGSSILRGLSLVSNMFETFIERQEHEQQLDQPLAVAERDLKRTSRALEIEDAKAEMISRVKAANVRRDLASAKAALDLSKTELDLYIARSQLDKLAVLNGTGSLSERMTKINAIQASVTARIAAYNSLFGQVTTLSTVTESTTTNTVVDMSAYNDFATVSDDDDDVIL